MVRTILLVLAMLALPAVAFLVGALIMERWSGRAEVVPADQKPLFQRFHYNVEEVRTYWQAFGEELPREQLFLKLDLGFPFLYGGGLAAGLLLAWATLVRPFPPPAWLLAPVFLGVLADWTENLVQLGQMRIYVGEGPQALQASWIGVASAATVIKLISLAGASVLLMILVGMVIAQAFRAS